MTARRSWLILGAVLACGVAPLPVAAQVLRVTLRDSITEGAVVGAIVAALDATGRPVAEGLTDTRGERTLRLPAAGPYRVRVRRIGLRPIVTAPTMVDAGATAEVALRLTSARGRLADVRVRALAVCGRTPDGDTRLAALFDQLDVALRATALSRADGDAPLRLRVREFERELGRELSLVFERTTRRGSGVGRTFVAVDPERLARDGFVVREGDGGFRFFAPDEGVLTSDAFVRTHCFEAPPPDGTAGGFAELRFRPAPGRRRPDVEGVVLIDTLTGEPRRIAFTYVSTTRLLPVPVPQAGGEVVLERLVDGTWFLPRWSIRMPLFGETDAGTRVIVAGYREVGGESAPERTALSRFGTALLEPRGVTLQLRLRDETGQPVGGARVVVDSVAPAGLLADADGRVRIVAPDTGRFTIRVRRIGSAPLDTVIATSDRGTLALDLVVPRLQQLATVAVRGDAMLDRVGYLSRRRLGIGYFRDSTELWRRNATNALILLQNLPGIELYRVPPDVAAPAGDRELLYQWIPGVTLPLMRLPATIRGQTPYCLPLLTINGRFTTAAELAAMAAEEIVAFEHYPRVNQVPVEYRRLSTGFGCGAVLFWARQMPN